MPSQREFLAQTGFLTFAHNSKDVNYFELAEMQAASIKRYMPAVPVAVVADRKSTRLNSSH